MIEDCVDLTLVRCQSCCAGVFIDLKKAFDAVDHELLTVEKLIVYGIRGVANKWLQNYLANRKQYVVIDDHSSDLLDMTCGVPQGSVLGPILFIYINDICNVSDGVKCVLFADDTYSVQKEMSLICNSL